MKINIETDINRESFMVHEHVVAGEIVYLVQPIHFGAKWSKDNLHLRSSVWNYEGELISAGFPKFFNWSEQPDISPVPESLKNCTVVEKLDGCCDENTIIITENGEKTIKEICESKYKGKVLGFDIDSKNEVWTDVIEHSIKVNNHDWYEIELMNGTTIKLTGNHKVWLPELNCYRHVSDLTENDVFLLKK